MARHRDEYDDEMEEEEEYDPDQAIDEDEEEEEEEERGGGGRRPSQKRRRSDFIDDVAEEDDDEEEEEDDEDDEAYGGGGGGGGASRKRKNKRPSGSQFLDIEAEVDTDEEEEDEEGDDDFIADNAPDLPEEEDGRRMRHRPLMQEDEQEDLEEIERNLQERYGKSSHREYDEDTTDVDQQALLPSVRDPKLWMVKCAIGREREVAVCLMQKYIDKPELQIRSVIALDHLKNYVYVEADKEAHVREACKGLRNIFGQKIMLVPIREMTDVLSVESKAIDLSRDTWVRMKSGTYKGDLAQVADVDNVRQRVTVKLIPRIDLQALANKMDGREVVRTKAFVPPPRLLNIEEARELHILGDRKQDRMTGDYYQTINGMMFKDGFLFKAVSIKSISTQNIHPTFDELEKFRKPSENGDGDVASLSTLFSNRKKGHFLKGDAVIVVKGDLKNLKGWVEKVEEDTVHIRPEMKELPKTLAINEKELCKYFEPGNHVKVVSGTQEGATGMVVKVEQHVLIILSDVTKEHIRVFADDVVESSEVTSGITRIGAYELHDLVLLDNNSFGVIIRVESEAFQVLKGVPDRPEVALVKLREIKCKIEKSFPVEVKYKHKVSVKDVVRVIDGPCEGKQGPVQHIYRGVLFIFDRHHLEHAGFICVKSHNCALVGGSRANGDRNGNSNSRYDHLRTPPRVPQSPNRFSRGGPPSNYGGRNRGGRGHDGLVGTTVKIRQGAYKGYRGRVVEVKGPNVRVELESQMKVVTVDRNCISDNVTVTTPYRDTSRYGMGSETPMHPSRTPLHPYMTPMRDAAATPIHDGMRTPMRDRAWNPYAPMSPARDNWEEGNPASWGASPQYQPGSPPPSRAYEAPTPGSGWANTPGGNYSEAGTPRDSSSAYANAPSPYLPSTPGGQPMTPNSASYLPGTPGGQPMTPGTGGLDMLSPVIGGDSEGPWFLPDILVSVHSSGEETTGVVREVLPDGSCRVAIGSGGNGETIIALPNEMEAVVPKKSDKIKIMGGSLRGATGKLIGVDGTDGIVKVDDTLDVKILDLAILSKLAQS